MKSRIRSIFILMTLCILGINAFQGYWLYSTYILQREQFYRTAMEALLMSLEKQQEADARQLIQGPTSGVSAPGVSTPGTLADGELNRRGDPEARGLERLFLVEVEGDLFGKGEEGTANEKTRVNVRTFHRKVSPDSLIKTLPADTLARRLSNRILHNWVDALFNLPRMDSAYRAELKLRKVEADFRLDTLQLNHPQADSATLRAQKEAEFPLRLQPVPVNPVQNLFLQASFRKPFPYILGKMSWLLAGSFVLLLLTTGCFLYMLSTILRQKKLSEIKNDFINNMTHELKTPLSTVSAAVEAMLSFGALNDSRKAQLYLTVSKNELQRLSDLVEQVLTMAVEETRELALETELVNSAELIREIVAHHRIKATKSVDFVVETSHEDQWVRVDRLHMGNAINNLIDNAIKYSRERVTIRLNSRQESNGWRLAVQDNGIGIPKSYQKAIFDRFFRVPAGNLHQVKGFGLGLSYVRQVVEKHGGHVEVHSEPAQGSEFVLWLPVINYQ